MRKEILGVHHIDANSKMDPVYATENSACFDLRANFGPMFREITVYDKDNDKRKKYAYHNSIVDQHVFILQPQERALIPTGIIFDIPVGFSLKLYSRSGLSLKSGLCVANGTGVIDSDYVMQTYVIIENRSGINVAIQHGERIAQAELCQCISADFYMMKTPPEQKTTRVGGFGSTGKD